MYSFLPYNPNNAYEIKKLFIKVFTDSEGADEGLLIGDLVGELMTTTEDKDMFGFVATDNDKIIGSVFFTRLKFENNNNVFILSPMAIMTDYQGKGIGQKLINFGIKTLKENNIKWLFTYGDIKFYSKIGFKLINDKQALPPFKLTYPEGWLAQSLIGDDITKITGKSSCVKALNKVVYW
ncbi:MAG: GNAT family N-acetyltransferase [Gammaproteobacteria bacterium]|nr:MAG: GNAT family N-acetyltransferase [Gammaproteobacteria bacterium]